MNAREIVLILLGAKWSKSIPYLQILCLSAYLYPLQLINLNVLKAKGRSDLYLRLEIIKKVASIPAIILGVVFGMEALLWGIVFNSIIVYLLNSTYSVDLIHYPVKKQLLDILPTILCFSVISAFSMIVGSLLGSNIFTSFIVKTLAFCVIVIAVGEIFHVSEYKECKKVLRDSVC